MYSLYILLMDIPSAYSQVLSEPDFAKVATVYPGAAERLREFCRLRLLQLRARRAAAAVAANEWAGCTIAPQSGAPGAGGRGGGTLCQVSEGQDIIKMMLSFAFLIV